VGIRTAPAVTHAGVQDWCNRLSAAGLAGSTVRQAHRVLALVLALAVRDKRIPSNPAEGVRLPRAKKSEKHFLSAAEVARLADAAGRDRVVILVLAYTGLRFGELAAIRAGRVDLMRRRIDVAESVTEVNGVARFGTPKTHQRRSVPLPRFLVDDVAALIAGKAASDLVFTAREGGVLRLMNFRRRSFDPAARAVELEGLTPHGLRHTAASLAIAAGANVKAVQRMLGHASAAMTLDVYAGPVRGRAGRRRGPHGCHRSRRCGLSADRRPGRRPAGAQSRRSDYVGRVGLEPTTEGL
jgi:integrase